MSSHIKEDEVVWVPGTADKLFETATVLAVSGGIVTVQRLNGKIETLNTRNTRIYPCNANVVEDLTSLRYFHEPAILHNLEARSLGQVSEKDKAKVKYTGPYTRMGSSVLVCVNPLLRIRDPPDVLGTRKAASLSHPFSVAELAYQQLVFAVGRANAMKMAEKNTEVKSDEDATTNPTTAVNQAIVVGGESGAGKTESSKMVMKHLVARCVGKESGQGDNTNMDARLLSCNPILEAFGNAATLRNSNSSRFGRFFRMHMEKNNGANKTVLPYTIGGATVKSYLLERSRVTHHEMGEQNYHIFYLIVAACSSGILNYRDLGLPKGSTTESWEYLQPFSGDKNSPKEMTRRFKEFDAALKDLGIYSDERSALYNVVAALLHIGNLIFNNVDTSEGEVAVLYVDGSAKSAAELLGLTVEGLGRLFTQREVKAVGETLVVGRTVQGAIATRDAFARGVYASMFDWVVERINTNLATAGNEESSSDEEKKSAEAVAALPFIGVLDIFGFESFERNDFETILINTCNETLQGTFNRQIFEAELDLFHSEGLLGRASGNQQEAVQAMERMRDAITLSSRACLELLFGNPSNRATPGILQVITAQGQVPDPSDTKLIQALHRGFKGRDKFIKVHPRDMHKNFIVSHYAGEVAYSVGSFLKKDADKSPGEMDALLESCKDDTVRLILMHSATTAKRVADAALLAEGGKGKKKKKKKRAATTITSKFSGQMDELVDTLEASRCTFIRCIKPNPLMRRSVDDVGSVWFDRRYVSMQLKNLSIPQTAELLSNGYPTRLDFNQLIDAYQSVLPASALAAWKRGSSNDDEGEDSSSSSGSASRSFVAALFFAYEIPADAYKLGLTKVFFESGMLDKLDETLQAAANFSEGKDKGKQDAVAKRFQMYFSRSRWRNAFAKVSAVVKFTRMMRSMRSVRNASVMIQTSYRTHTLRKEFLLDRRRAVLVQNLVRQHAAMKQVSVLRAAKRERLRIQAEERRLAQEEARRKYEEAQRRAAEEVRKQEEARKVAEAARLAAEAADAAEKKRLQEIARRAEEEEVRARKAAEEEAARAEEDRLAQEAAEAAVAAAVKEEEEETQRRVEEEIAMKKKQEATLAKLKEVEVKENERRAAEESARQSIRMSRTASMATVEVRGSIGGPSGHMRGPSGVKFTRHESMKLVEVNNWGKKMRSLAVCREQARFGRKKWMTRFVALHKVKRAIYVFEDRESFNKKIPKAIMTFVPEEGAEYEVEVLRSMEKQKYVLALRHKSKKVKDHFLSFDSEESVNGWRDHVMLAQKGMPGTEMENDLSELDEMEEEIEMGDGGGLIPGTESEEELIQRQDELSFNLIEQMDKFKQLHRAGKISEEALRSAMRSLSETLRQPENVSQEQEFVRTVAGQQLICRNCATPNNTLYGANCLGCNTPLAVMGFTTESRNNVDTVALLPIPRKASLVSTVNTDAGKLLIFSAGSEVANDFFDMTPKTKYVFICQWLPSANDKPEDRWRVSHTFAAYGALSKGLIESNADEHLPPFPEKESVWKKERSRVDPNKVRKREGLLVEWFKSLFKCLDDPIYVLELPEIDHVFEYSEHTFDVKFGIDTSDSDGDDSADDKPLRAAEMSNAEQSVKKLLDLLRSGADITKNMKMQALYDNLQDLRPRIQVSKDFGHPLASDDILRRAYEVEDGIQRLTRQYTDALSAKMYMASRS